MKKIILVILMLSLLPIFTFAKLIEENIDFRYKYDWISFLGRGTQEYHKKGNWPYGYKEWDNGVDGPGHKHLFIPKTPKEFKCPAYLNNYPLANRDINVNNVRDNMYSEDDAIELIRCQNGYAFEEGILFGVTANNNWFVVNNYGYTHTKMPGDRHDKFRPFTDAKIGIMKTIMMHCEKEKRNPTLSEKYIMLYLDMCGDQLSRELDQDYQQYYAKDYRATQRAKEVGLWVGGPIKLVGWCLLALFAFVLPGLILVMLKCIFPKGSVVYNAVCALEVLLGIFVISYWYGSKR